MFLHKSFKSSSFNESSFRFESIQYVASLGGAPYKSIKEEDEIEEPINAETVNRIRNEFLSVSLANDLISRAKRRKAQAEEALILLLI